MYVKELTEPVVVKWAELMPKWVVPHATEPGYLRFNLSYVGGAEGLVNINRETNLLSDRTAIGLMWMPVGQRQFALHCHTTAETYVILKGAVESIEPDLESIEPDDRFHYVGTLDCMHMPVGSPHAARTVGTEDVMLLWFHDGLEAADAAIYYDENDPRLSGLPRIRRIKLDSLAPSWDAPGAREAGTLRSLTSYIGGPSGYLNYNRETCVVSERNAAGTTMIPVGNAEVPQAYGTTRYCLVLSGEAAVVDHPEVPVAGSWDMIIMPRNAPYAVRAVGIEPLHMLWILEDAEPEKKAA